MQQSNFHYSKVPEECSNVRDAENSMFIQYLHSMFIQRLFKNPAREKKQKRLARR